ncbi:unnamed protein product [Effrenium voratum]|uniref:J domain-containing protein n=1 Tax=Effrenium voratum TaxID=2562239 RepID=A0AA36J0U5_9DINO|nr:unnamed protein product [Effrenium voratum]
MGARIRGGLCLLALVSLWSLCLAFQAPRARVARHATKQREAKAKAKQVDELIDLEDFDAWEVLALPPDADKQKIRRRFRKLVATQHPDKRPNDPDAPVKFMRIKKAYEQLMGGGDTLKELKQWAEQNREWSESAREFLGEEEDLAPPDVPPALYAGLAALLGVLAYGTYWALHK